MKDGAVLDPGIVRNPRISAQSKALYWLLVSYMTTDGDIPVQPQLAADMGTTVKTIQTWLSELEGVGEVFHTKGGRNHPARYYLRRYLPYALSVDAPDKAKSSSLYDPSRDHNTNPPSLYDPSHGDNANSASLYEPSRIDAADNAKLTSHYDPSRNGFALSPDETDTVDNANSTSLYDPSRHDSVPQGVVQTPNPVQPHEVNLDSRVRPPAPPNPPGGTVQTPPTEGREYEQTRTRAGRAGLPPFRKILDLHTDDPFFGLDEWPVGFIALVERWPDAGGQVPKRRALLSGARTPSDPTPFSRLDRTLEAWLKIATTPQKAAYLVDRMGVWAASHEWQKQGGRYVPWLDNWLEQGKYDHEPQAAPSPGDDVDAVGPDAASRAWNVASDAARKIGADRSVTSADRVMLRAIRDLGGWPRFAARDMADHRTRLDFLTAYRDALGVDPAKHPDRLTGRLERSVATHPFRHLLDGEPLDDRQAGVARELRAKIRTWDMDTGRPVDGEPTAEIAPAGPDPGRNGGSGPPDPPRPAPGDSGANAGTLRRMARPPAARMNGARMTSIGHLLPHRTEETPQDGEPKDPDSLPG